MGEAFLPECLWSKCSQRVYLETQGTKEMQEATAAAAAAGPWCLPPAVADLRHMWFQSPSLAPSARAEALQLRGLCDFFVWEEPNPAGVASLGGGSGLRLVSL